MTRKGRGRLAARAASCSCCAYFVVVPVLPVVPPVEPDVPLELEPMPVLPPVPVDVLGVVLVLPGEVVELLPALEPPWRVRQSVFAVPLRSEQSCALLAPLVLDGLLVELELDGVELEPLLEPEPE